MCALVSLLPLVPACAGSVGDETRSTRTAIGIDYTPSHEGVMFVGGVVLSVSALLSDSIFVVLSASVLVSVF